MRIRRSIIWFVAIAAVLIVLVLWFGKKQPVERPSTASIETNAPPPATAANVPVKTPIRTNTPVTQVAPHAPIPPPPLKTKEQQMREGLAELNDENVVLYGKVIDQYNVPVAGATVSGVIQVNNGVRVGTDRLSLTTDANGAFTVSGYKGKNLGITIKKAGYALATTNTSFVYSLLWPEPQRHIPDPNNPVVFKMWKLQGVEPLVGIDKTYKLHYTPRPLNFDLLAGQIVPSGGDLKITVSRSPGVVSEHNPQDWSVQVEAVDGGLIETSVAESRVTYAAPEDGYLPSATFVMSTATQSWHAGLDQMFFIDSRGGQVYSKINFGIGINQQPDGKMEVEFRGVASTNGSRNWEGDPNTMNAAPR